jgi:hypothetical protein
MGHGRVQAFEMPPGPFHWWGIQLGSVIYVLIGLCSKSYMESMRLISTARAANLYAVSISGQPICTLQLLAS